MYAGFFVVLLVNDDWLVEFGVIPCLLLAFRFACLCWLLCYYLMFLVCGCVQCVL